MKIERIVMISFHIFQSLTNAPVIPAWTEALVQIETITTRAHAPHRTLESSVNVWLIYL